LALAADNYYESLGISASEKVGLNDAKVRRAYLKTSVKVRGWVACETSLRSSEEVEELIRS